MKHFKRHILIWLFLFYGLSVNASHVLGGEIFYTHLKNNQYKVTLNIYRDCNGCKINGSGGGNNPDNCSEIDYIFVKGFDNSGFKETKFALNREKITDITPSCRTKISTCNSGANSIYGIELHQFSATINLDNSVIKGFCNYNIYVTLAERNNNITTGQAKQNFCIDALINSCLDSKNNSPTFISEPSFIVNNNKSQYQSAYAIDKDNDSLKYSLTPALFGLEKEVSYGTGFSYSNPMTTYCPEIPCNADKVKETGFYLDNSNGTIVYIPTRASEIGIVAMKVEEYRKISGQWVLIGYVKRDIQVSVKTSDGNNSPKFLNKDYFEICEGEPLEIKIETSDERNSITMDFDSVSYDYNTSIIGSSFIQYSQSSSPFNYGLFKWTPPIGASETGKYSVSVSATDNFCPLNATSNQIISIKVKPKEDLKVTTRNLGCGNFEISSSKISSLSKLAIKVYSVDGIKKEIFVTSLLLDTISFLPSGKYLLTAILSSPNGCETVIQDTIFNINTRTKANIIGESKVCKDVNYNYSIDNLTPIKYYISWMFNSKKVGTGMSLTASFNDVESLKALLDFKKGKWVCADTLKKAISIIEQPEILTTSKNEICHLSGDFNLNNISITPTGGKWSSSNLAYLDGVVKTNLGLSYYDDTVVLNYEVTNSGCVYSKDINLIILAVPEFELSTLTICEVTSPVLFEHLIKKPYAPLNYTFSWNFPLFPDKIKDFSGSTGFNPSDLGFGNFEYAGEVTSKNGCKNFDTASIEITPVLKIKFQNEINLCQGSDPVDITKLSGVTPDNGNWSFYYFDLIVDRKYALTDTCGVFEVTYVYDNYGCYDTKKVNVTIACKPQMAITGLKDNICDSELPVQLTATPSGGMWKGNFVLGNIFSPPLIPNIKKHTLSYLVNQGLCNFKETRTVSVIPAPVIDLNPDKFNYCHPESITLTGNISNSDKLTCKYFGNSFDENINGSKSFNNSIFKSIYNKVLESQIITLTATNDAGCSTTSDIGLNVFDQPKITPFNDTFVCDQSSYNLSPSIQYDGNNDLVYSWLENSKVISVFRNLNSNDLSVGMHTLLFNAGNEFCKDYKSVNIEIKPRPMVDFIIKPTNTTTIIQPTFWFQNQSGINKSSYWQFGNNRSDNYSYERSPKYTYIDTGSFIVSLTETDEYGCSNTLTQTVLVKPDLLIFIPNAFTPNNKDEEKNNVFSVSLQNYATYSIEIYDRWGHRVFYSENPTETWDGKSGNVSCTPDIYFYSIKINSITNHLFKYRGTITLIK